MKNNGVKYGLIYGGLIVLLMLLAYFTNPKSLFSYFSWRTILGFVLMVGLMFWSAKVTRDQKGGYLGFGEAFVPPFLTFIIGSAISTAVLSALLAFDSNLQEVAADASADMLISMYETVGFSEDQIEESVEIVEEQMGDNNFSVGSMVIGLLTNAIFMGLPISAIIGAIVKKKRPDDGMAV